MAKKKIAVLPNNQMMVSPAPLTFIMMFANFHYHLYSFFMGFFIVCFLIWLLIKTHNYFSRNNVTIIQDPIAALSTQKSVPQPATTP